MDWRGSRGMKRTNSDEAISSMTVDVDALRQICPAQFQDQSIVWTDEKHNLYIESLEAAFVQQLHHSIGYSNRNLLDQQSGKTYESSDKFTGIQARSRRPKSKLRMDTTNNKFRELQCMHNYGSSHISTSNGALTEVSDENFIDEQEG